MSRTIRNSVLAMVAAVASAAGCYALMMALIHPGATHANPGDWGWMWPFTRLAVPVVGIIGGVVVGVALERIDRRRAVAEALDGLPAARTVEK